MDWLDPMTAPLVHHTASQSVGHIVPMYKSLPTGQKSQISAYAENKYIGFRLLQIHSIMADRDLL